jgi:hypothetical protein
LSQAVPNRPQLPNSLLPTPALVSQSFCWIGEHDCLHLITPGYSCLIPFSGIWFTVWVSGLQNQPNGWPCASGVVSCSNVPQCAQYRSAQLRSRLTTNGIKQEGCTLKHFKAAKSSHKQSSA